jgi:hypothetical protein
VSGKRYVDLVCTGMQKWKTQKLKPPFGNGILKKMEVIFGYWLNFGEPIEDGGRKLYFELIYLFCLG